VLGFVGNGLADGGLLLFVAVDGAEPEGGGELLADVVGCLDQQSWGEGSSSIRLRLCLREDNRDRG
jgi:hypothetical protein